MKTTSADKTVVTIDTQGLMDRITLVSPAFGTQLDPVVFQKSDKTYVFYSSNHGEGRGALYRTVIEPFTPNKTEKVADGGIGTLFETGGKYYALSRGAIQKYNIDANKFDKVDVSMKFQRNLEKEFSQMFYETWAGIEENFYDGTFHGIDWSAVKKQYEAYLPNINNRADLRILLNDMLGELNASHLGFNSSGPEERKSFTAVTNEIGVVYDTKDPWKVSQIIVNSPASRKGIDIKEGDILLAVNGQNIDKTRDRDSYFTLPSLAEEMALTFSRQGKEINVNIRPQPANAQREQLYDEWIKANRAKVDGMSNNRIAYSHMKNMGVMS